MSSEVTVPTLGESISEATIGEWLKQPGEPVAQDEPIASLETDKVSVEVTAPAAGLMGDQLAEVGDTVTVGAVIATIAEGEGAAPAAKKSAKSKAKAAAPAGEASPGEAPTLSPAVRRAVLEHGVDPSSIKGTGKDGRITKEDVLAAAEAKGSEASDGGKATPSPAPAPPQPVSAAWSASR